MKGKVFLFIMLILGIVFFFRPERPVQQGRKLSSINQDMDYNEIAFLRASAIFEKLQLSTANEYKSNQLISFKAEMNKNLERNDNTLSLMSLAALIKINEASFLASDVNQSLKDFINYSYNCSDIANCLFYINLITKIAKKFDVAGLSELLNRNDTGSFFANLLQRKVQAQNIDFLSTNEEENFLYVLGSTIIHLKFQYKMNQNLNTTVDKYIFSGEWTNIFKRQLEDLVTPENQTNVQDLEERQMIGDIILNPSFNDHSLTHFTRTWQFRNTLLSGYLPRFKNYSIRAWYDQNQTIVKEQRQNILKRYFEFEIKLAQSELVLRKNRKNC